jgi:tetratricopeptide (TPR) repeat protein
LTVGSIAALAVLIVGLMSGAKAVSAWRSNWGAVRQTQAELSVYRWPEWPMQDALRRSGKINLAAAILQYQSALTANPANATARRRLGQIELARGEYEQAQRDLQAAFASAPGQRATRQLLGEAYAVAGEIERAATLWRTIDASEGQLQARQWWYSEYLKDYDRAAHMTQAMAALNP